MEASTISEWVARLPAELGHEVVVADPDYAPIRPTTSFAGMSR
jgi:transposase